MTIDDIEKIMTVIVGRVCTVCVWRHPEMENVDYDYDYQYYNCSMVH
jgi:hypothetical protein